MALYNLYANGTLLNSKPLTTEDVVNIMNKEFVHKKHKWSGQLEKIPTNRIKVVKTILL